MLRCTVTCSPVLRMSLWFILRLAGPVCGWHTFSDLLWLSHFPPSFSCLSKEFSVRSLVLLALCVSVAVVWGVYRNEDRYCLRSLTNGCCCSSRFTASGLEPWLCGLEVVRRSVFFYTGGKAARRACCCFQQDIVLFNSWDWYTSCLGS